MSTIIGETTNFSITWYRFVAMIRFIQPVFERTTITNGSTTHHLREEGWVGGRNEGCCEARCTLVWRYLP